MGSLVVCAKHPTGSAPTALESSCEDVMTVFSRNSCVSGASITSGVAMALIPKCPACVAAYFGFLSAFGIDQWAPDYLWPLTYSLFAVSVAFLGFRAWRRAFYPPFALALVGAGVLAVARAQDASSALVWTGCGVFLLAVLWSARRSPAQEPAHCHSSQQAKGAVS